MGRSFNLVRWRIGPIAESLNSTLFDPGNRSKTPLLNRLMGIQPSLAADRKADHESTPLRTIRFHPYLSAMPFHDMFHDRESKPSSSQLS